MSATGRRTGETGATLVEAMVAVAITAMIGGILFPVMSQGVARAAFGQATSGLRADLRMARAQALRTGESIELIVAGAGDGYGWTPGPQRGLIAGLALAPAGARIGFYPDGSSSGGELMLGQGRRRARFAIDPQTGLAEDAS